MAGLDKPCSPQRFSGSCVTAEVAAFERLVPVLQDVMNKELKDLRDLKPLHDSLSNRLDGASQENAAQFETLREIVKRLSTSLRDKAEIAEVTALVEQHCGDRIDALEISCNKLVARLSKCEQQCLVHNTEAKDAGVILDLQLTNLETNGAGFDELMCSSTTSPVKRYSIDTVRGDPPCKDDTKQSANTFRSELDLMRYECELERLRCMVIEGQSAMGQLRTALARERETGVAERARLDGLQKSLADNVVTISRTHGSVGERLQHMQQTIDDLTNATLEKKHSNSSENILGDATTQGMQALRHHHSCLEALRHRLESIESSLSERQDSMENMVSEENRRIWLAMERSLDIGRTEPPTSAGSSAQVSDSGRQQQAVNTEGTADVAVSPLPPIVVPITSIPPPTCSSPPVPGRNVGTSVKLVPCSRSSTPTQSPGHYGASSLSLQPGPRAGTSVSLPQPQGASPWHGTSAQTPPPLPPAIRSPAHGGGCGGSAPSQLLGMGAEVARTPTNGCSGAVTPVRCTSPPPVVTPVHGADTPRLRRSGSLPPFDPSRTPQAVRAGSPTPPQAVRAGSPTPETPMTASPPTVSRSPSRKHIGTPGRPPPASPMASPGGTNHRSLGGSPLVPQRHTAHRNRGGTPHNTAAVHRRGCQQEHVSRLPNELGAASRVRGQ